MTLALRSAIDRLSAWNVGDTHAVAADYPESHQCQTDLALVLAAARAMAADASDEEMAILMPAEQGDMVRRLRNYMRHTCNGITCKLCDDAATRIEALEAALREIGDMHLPDQPAALNMPDYDYAVRHIREMRRAARKALAP